MARKKQEASSGGNAPWLNTFADLMNLLLCFFVLLFSYSTVDAQKYEEIAVSMANSIGVFEAGGSSIGEGQLISSGMNQLSELSVFFSTMGKNSQSNMQDENSQEGIEGSEGSKDSQDVEDTQTVDNTQNTQSSQDTASTDQEKLSEALKQIEEEMKSITANMYDQVSDMTEQNNLGDYVELSIDPEFQFVQLTLKGSILYDSGKAEIKEVAKPILSKVGDVLKKFDGYTIEIVGHTDNVPISSSSFKDNNWLSSARALNAAEFLINKSEIDPATLKYSGRGEYEPISSNSTADGRARNRRIEIKIYNEYSSK